MESPNIDGRKCKKKQDLLTSVSPADLCIMMNFIVVQASQRLVGVSDWRRGCHRCPMERAGDSPGAPKSIKVNCPGGLPDAKSLECVWNARYAILERRVPSSCTSSCRWRAAVSCQGRRLCGWELRHCSPAADTRQTWHTQSFLSGLFL